MADWISSRAMSRRLCRAGGGLEAGHDERLLVAAGDHFHIGNGLEREGQVSVLFVLIAQADGVVSNALTLGLATAIVHVDEAENLRAVEGGAVVHVAFAGLHADDGDFGLHLHGGFLQAPESDGAGAGAMDAAT